jgi:hypothetical protein
MNAMKAIFSPIFRSPFSALITLSLLASGLLTTPLAQEDPWAGKRVVPLLQEPRHRTVYQDGEVYLLDVQVNPGDTSLPHTHSSAILLTYISNAEGPANGRVNSNTDYATTPFTHEVTNAGPGLLRIMALTSFAPGKSDLTLDRAIGINVEPQLENNWFRSYRLELEPGEEAAMQTYQNPAVLIQVSEGIVHIRRVDGITAELNKVAGWTWCDAGSAVTVRNAGSVPVALVINEARR